LADSSFSPSSCSGRRSSPRSAKASARAFASSGMQQRAWPTTRSRRRSLPFRPRKMTAGRDRPPGP